VLGRVAELGITDTGLMWANVDWFSEGAGFYCLRPSWKLENTAPGDGGTGEESLSGDAATGNALSPESIRDVRVVVQFKGDVNVCGFSKSARVGDKVVAGEYRIR